MNLLFSSQVIKYLSNFGYWHSREIARSGQPKIATINSQIPSWTQLGLKLPSLEEFYFAALHENKVIQ